MAAKVSALFGRLRDPDLFLSEIDDVLAELEASRCWLGSLAVALLLRTLPTRGGPLAARVERNLGAYQAPVRRGHIIVPVYLGSAVAQRLGHFAPSSESEMDIVVAQPRRVRSVGDQMVLSFRVLPSTTAAATASTFTPTGKYFVHVEPHRLHYRVVFISAVVFKKACEGGETVCCVDAAVAAAIANSLEARFVLPGEGSDVPVDDGD